MCNPNQQELDRLATLTEELDAAQILIDKAIAHAAANKLDDEAFYAQVNARQFKLNEQRATVEALTSHYQTFC